MATYRETAKKMVTCPYDPAHRMLNSRLQAHITKCKQNHLDAHLKPCPFNAQHLEKEANLNFHMMNCPDRFPLDKQLASGVYKNEISKGSTVVPSYYEAPSYVNSSEVWDLDPNSSYGGYTPKDAFRPNAIIGDLGLLKPAQRKEIYRRPIPTSDEPAKPTEEMKSKSKQEPMRQPKLTAETLHAMMKNMNPPPSKIAANIFGPNSSTSRQPASSYKNLLPEMNTLNLGIGRGRGALSKE